MVSPDPQSPAGDDGSVRIRKFFGLLLLVSGFLASAWTFLQAYRLMTDPSEISLVATLGDRGVAARSIILPEGTIEIPPAFVKIGAYGTVVAFLAVCAGIARTMVRAGASLLQVDLWALAKQLRKGGDTTP